LINDEGNWRRVRSVSKDSKSRGGGLVKRRDARSPALRCGVSFGLRKKSGGGGLRIEKQRITSDDGRTLQKGVSLKWQDLRAMPRCEKAKKGSKELKTLRSEGDGIKKKKGGTERDRAGVEEK